MSETAFKRCSVCEKIWESCREFVLDETLRLNGYQASFDGADDGILMLTHACGTTLGIEAGKLRHLYHGPQYAESLANTDRCRHLCLDEDRLEECDAPCAMAWVRQVLQCLRRHELPEE